MFRKSITALTTAAIIATGASTPAFAGDTEDRIAKFLAGALVLYAIKEAADSKRNRTVAATPAPVQPKPNRKVIPAKCVFKYETAKGNRTLAHKGCLQKHYRNVNRLPQNCERRLFTSRGWREGFGRKCLKNAGYRIG